MKLRTGCLVVALSTLGCTDTDTAADSEMSDGGSNGDGDGTCTLSGCDDSFTAELAETLAPGDYRLDVQTEAGMGYCDVTVLGGTGEDSGIMRMCGGDVNVSMGPSAIGIEGNPSSVSITLEDTESGLIAQGEFADLEYEQMFPNGPNCGSCGQTTVQMPELTDPNTL